LDRHPDGEGDQLRDVVGLYVDPPARQRNHHARIERRLTEIAFVAPDDLRDGPRLLRAKATTKRER
jgi:hypothetical protein